ncbi:hypothetical protein AXG93_773s1810 [Marchantia polymorpha subsp. ruderalis]|uniref:Uncharacterized protein n=1 Tax=Marchantia polymorpha subsp. ruderalis TaxID=1480154 RepID=A0A176W9Z9_MARPO|nr:hypothetical protein AXG93_773s1810 [Marchantia polymorpha subsp. ruderalis]
MMTLEFPREPKWQSIPRKVKDSAAQKKSLNDDIFNSHKLDRELRRWGIPERRELVPTFHERIMMNFLLWSWNWASAAIVQEWNNNGLPKPSRYRGNLEIWQIWHWKKVLGRCADDDGDLTFDSESVKVRFVKRALRGECIHWARIFLTAIWQHIGLVLEGSSNYLSLFFINFYRVEIIQFLGKVEDESKAIELEANISTESKVATSRGRFTPKARAELNMVSEKKAPMEKDFRTSAVSLTPIVSGRATRKEKGKAIMTE